VCIRTIMTAYSLAILRRTSGGRANHSVRDAVGRSGDGLDGWLVRGAGARLVIGDFLSGSPQQRSQTIGQGQQGSHGNARIAPIGNCMCIGRGRSKVGCRPSHVPTPSIGQDHRYPVRTTAGRFGSDIKPLTEKRMAPLRDRDLSDQPFDNSGSLR
jgi:hypothetical protein